MVKGGNKNILSTSKIQTPVEKASTVIHLSYVSATSSWMSENNSNTRVFNRDSLHDEVINSSLRKHVIEDNHQTLTTTAWPANLKAMPAKANDS